MELPETLIPAYGRDYTNRDAVLDDILAGKDFIVAITGQATNRADLVKMGYTEVWVRFNYLRRKDKFTLA